jgi:hypothetical protein
MQSPQHCAAVTVFCITLMALPQNYCCACSTVISEHACPIDTQMFLSPLLSQRAPVADLHVLQLRQEGGLMLLRQVCHCLHREVHVDQLLEVLLLYIRPARLQAQERKACVSWVGLLALLCCSCAAVNFSQSAGRSCSQQVDQPYLLLMYVARSHARTQLLQQAMRTSSKL